MPSSDFLEIPIDIGTKPDWNTRLGFPSITNLFVGDSGHLYSTAGLQNLITVREIKSSRAIYYSIFDSGAYFVVTDTSFYKVLNNGIVVDISTIVFSGLPVQITENLQNQISFVDGLKLYAYDQRKRIFMVLTQEQGFTLKTPISILTLNTFTIVLDGYTGKWVVSDPDNALSYPALDFVPQIESKLTRAVGLASINNNLFILGLTGIERWVPNNNTNVYLFPFVRDDSFRCDVGPISTSAYTQALDKSLTPKIIFYSSKYVATELSLNGIRPLDESGISKITSQYPSVEDVYVSYYSFRGNNFIAFTFLEKGINWTLNTNNNTWALCDDLIISASHDQEVVATRNNLYSLSLIQSQKKRSFIGQRLTKDNGPTIYRNTLSRIEVKIIQGLQQNRKPEYIELSISTDSATWSSTIARQIGFIGDRRAICQWSMNVTAQEFTPRIEYYGDLDFVIEKIKAFIK